MSSDQACPFCGSNRLDVDLDDEHRGYCATCIACEAQGPWVPLHEGATEADKAELRELALARWNTRRERSVCGWEPCRYRIVLDCYDCSGCGRQELDRNEMGLEAQPRKAREFPVGWVLAWNDHGPRIFCGACAQARGLAPSHLSKAFAPKELP